MQSTRLATRMRREIQMLENDPPPGVSAWPCGDSLCHLEAQIQGPMGTVYAEGLFRLEIHIPERYPFEPPNVKFNTPIYHPNIDDAGRICLDILKMPPKGAWKPSWNVPTILASIGLLLSEPNPDDGLMADIAAEYKNNRLSFEATARKWTRQYANQKECGLAGKLTPPDVTNDIGSGTNSTQVKAYEGVAKACDDQGKNPQDPVPDAPLTGPPKVRKLSIQSALNASKLSRGLKGSLDTGFREVGNQGTKAGRDDTSPTRNKGPLACIENVVEARLGLQRENHLAIKRPVQCREKRVDGRSAQNDENLLFTGLNDFVVPLIAQETRTSTFSSDQETFNASSELSLSPPEISVCQRQGSNTADQRSAGEVDRVSSMGCECIVAVDRMFGDSGNEELASLPAPSITSNSNIIYLDSDSDDEPPQGKSKSLSEFPLNGEEIELTTQEYDNLSIFSLIKKFGQSRRSPVERSASSAILDCPGLSKRPREWSQSPSSVKYHRQGLNSEQTRTSDTVPQSKSKARVATDRLADTAISPSRVTILDSDSEDNESASGVMTGICAVTREGRCAVPASPHNRVSLVGCLQHALEVSQQNAQVSNISSQTAETPTVPDHLSCLTESLHCQRLGVKSNSAGCETTILDGTGEVGEISGAVVKATKENDTNVSVPDSESDDEPATGRLRLSLARRKAKYKNRNAHIVII